MMKKDKLDALVLEEKSKAGFLKSGRKSLSDTETSSAAKHLADLEEELWHVIFNNPSKFRYAIASIQQSLLKGARYDVPEELQKLMKRLIRTKKSRIAKSAFQRSMNSLVASLLEIDIDREIVAAAMNETIRRNTRNLANGGVTRSAHAMAVIKMAHRIESLKSAFIEVNQGLVVAIADKFKHRGMPFWDRVQEGNLGLIKAVNRFDYRLGYKFSTYASWWIRAAIGRAIDSKECMIRVPSSTKRNQSQLRRASREIWLRTGRRPTDDEIAQESGMGELKLSRARRHVVSTVFSLDEAIPGSDNLRYVDALPDETVRDPLEDMHVHGLLEEVDALMDSLTPLEQNIIKQRFGLGNEDRATLREIGDQYDLSRERIRQIQNKALEKLRTGMALDAA